MSKCNIIANQSFTTYKRKYYFVWSIAQRVGTKRTVTTLVDVVGVCIFKVALTVYQL